MGTACAKTQSYTTAWLKCFCVCVCAHKRGSGIEELSDIRLERWAEDIWGPSWVRWNEQRNMERWKDGRMWSVSGVPELRL